MAILKIVGAKNTGGILTCECQHIIELKRRGYTIDLAIVGNEGAFEKYSELGVNLHAFKYTNLEFSGNAIKKIWSVLRIIYCSFVYTRQYKSPVSYTAIIYRIPTLLFLAGFLKWKYNAQAFWYMPCAVTNGVARKFYKLVLGFFKIVPIANSEYSMNSFKGFCSLYFYPSFDPSRVKLSPSTLRSDLGIEENGFVFGIAARITTDKAQNVIIEALKKILVYRKDVYLLIAGGPLDSDFAKRCIQLADVYLNRNIFFVGYMNEMSGFYNSIDVYINSRINEEPFGISIAESLASGVPVIAYYLGGPSEMIEHGSNGLLVMSPTENDYLKAMEQAMGDFKDVKNRSKHLIVDSARSLSVQNSVTKFVDLLNSYASA